MARVQDVLHRRTDLSTFLVHFTRDHGDLSGRERLERIIDDGVLLTGSARGWAADQDDDDDPAAQSQRVVCFSETPLEHAWTLIEEIGGRRLNFEPYGVALPKYKARQLGVNPVWYVDMTPGRTWAIAQALDQIKEWALESGDFHRQPEAEIFPFIEQMGVWPNRTKEFWWEREWRKVGHLHLPSKVFYLCPEDEAEEIGRWDEESDASWRRRRREFIDPRWGLERIIAHLAGLPLDYITPFED